MRRIIYRTRTQVTPSFGALRRALIANTLTTVRAQLTPSALAHCYAVAIGTSRANLRALRSLRTVYVEEISLP